MRRIVLASVLGIAVLGLSLATPAVGQAHDRGWGHSVGPGHSYHNHSYHNHGYHNHSYYTPYYGGSYSHYRPTYRYYYNDRTPYSYGYAPSYYYAPTYRYYYQDYYSNPYCR